MIYYRQIFRTDKNIGRGYNEEMELVPDGSWVCFTDGDTCQLITDYGVHLERYIAKYPDVGIFTCMTNRVGQWFHLLKGRIDNNHDMLYHKRLASELVERSQLRLELLSDKNAPLSGVLMLINKDAWKQAGGFREGCLGVDNYIHQDCLDAGIKVGLMQDFYIYHFYRGHKDFRNTDHLK